MVPLKLIHELYDYNYWARDRQLAACAALTSEQFLQPMGSSFSSVRDTLAHFVAVEWVWLQRWQGRSPKRTDPDVREFAPEKFPTLELIRGRWKSGEQDVRNYLAGLTEEALARPLTYVNLDGETWTYPLWRTHLHVVNHQTYHRGQITTLLRQHGAEAVAVDFLVAHDMGFRL